MIRTYSRLEIACLFIVSLHAVAWAGDWPTHLHDNHRSGHTLEALKPPLVPQWKVTTDQPAQSAWSEYPAPQDLWQNLYNNKPRLTSDRAFHLIVGNGRLYYGSSSSDKVICRSIEDGSLLWTHITGGPIRFAPTFYQDRLYIEQYDASTRTEEGLGWGPGNHMVVTPSACFYSSDTALSKFDWIEKTRLWSVPCRYPDALILAGDLLFAGGQDQVAAVDTSAGSEVWKASVSGQVQNLVVADQCLFVSTSQGHIYCFQASTK